MNRKETLKAIMDELNRRRRSIDALRLLVEDDDPQTALVMSERLRNDLDGVIARLRALLESSPATAPAAPEAAPPVSPPPAPEPPLPPPVPVPAPVDVSAAAGDRGYLGDGQEAGGFERWVDGIVDGCWNTIAHPRQLIGRLYRRRNVFVSLLALGLAIYTGWNAYQKAYLADHGLVGEYYLDENFGTLFTKRTDPAINFRWLRRPPMTNFRSEHFSVRWTGYLKIAEGGPYEFYTVSDDGVRLWIDDQKLIDNWNIHGSTLDKGQITLKPGFHRVRLEYFQGEGDTVLKLQWRTAGESQKKNISPRLLFPRLPEG